MTRQEYKDLVSYYRCIDETHLLDIVPSEPRSARVIVPAGVSVRFRRLPT